MLPAKAAEPVLLGCDEMYGPASVLGITFSDKLKSLDGKLTSADAVNVAKKQFAERIAAEEADGKPAREVYVKLITGDRETYYFYVSFIGEGTDYWAALIDPSDGTVVSHR